MKQFVACVVSPELCHRLQCAKQKELFCLESQHLSQGSGLFLPLQAEIEIQGPGVTPFDADNQDLVINAFSYVMTTVTRADFLIRYYTSDSSQVPSFSGKRRLLLASQARSHSLAANLTRHCRNALCLCALGLLLIALTHTSF